MLYALHETAASCGERCTGSDINTAGFSHVLAMSSSVLIDLSGLFLHEQNGRTGSLVITSDA